MKHININAGDIYGCYTVLRRSDKAGKQEFYDVKCKCGAEWTIGKRRLRAKPQKCKKCSGNAYSAMMIEKRKMMIGQVINGFKIIDIIPSSIKGNAAKFVTECVFCGHKAEKTIDAMKYKKGEKCNHCPPDYHFRINGTVAVGYLDDGTEFKIDAEDIPLVSNYHWYVNGGGYLFRRDTKTRLPYRLHRVVLGLKQNDNKVVDHLNHDKLDNRKCNLSVGTQADNCLNNIKRCSNTIGHVGVKLLSENGNFLSRIEKSGKMYDLIITPNIEDAAQAYNVAADYLFGVGIGYRNLVLYPTQEFACKIIERIKEIQDADKLHPFFIGGAKIGKDCK